MKQAIDVSAPEGYETEETSAAKNLVMDIVQDTLEYWEVDTEKEFSAGYDAIAVADKIVEQLIAAGWRPTEEN